MAVESQSSEAADTGNEVASLERRQARFLAAARDIAGRIGDCGIELEGGGVTWAGPRSRAQEGELEMRPLGLDAYGGIAGIVLFLAAFARATGDDQARSLALAAMRPLRQRLRRLIAHPPPAEKVRIGLGGLAGLGSFVYAQLRVGQLLNEPQLAREAHDLTSLMTPARIAQDESLDITFGNAGAVLALLELDEVLPEPNRAGASPLDIAVVCGRHLMQNRARHDRFRAWTSSPELPPQTGFSHGTAGVCYALLRLFQRSGEEEFLAAAREGLAFERSLYSQEHRNWRDMRISHHRYMTTWCHGAPGIGLGRLGSLEILDDPEIREDIQNALETTRALKPAEVDHLCCGNMGRVEILFYAHHVLGDVRLLEEAHDLANWTLSRAEQQGGFTWLSEDEGAPKLFDPALFRGAAGVGLAALRLATKSQDLPFPLLIQ